MPVTSTGMTVQPEESLNPAAGMGCEDASKVLFLDYDTIRTWSQL
jgi:hypothetical protein